MVAAVTQPRVDRDRRVSPLHCRLQSTPPVPLCTQLRYHPNPAEHHTHAWKREVLNAGGGGERFCLAVLVLHS